MTNAPRKLPIGEIVRDDRLQVRNELVAGTVLRYADVLRSENKLPPITVARINGAYVLLDGWHRIAAAERVGAFEIDADVVEGVYIEEAKWLAASANLKHGLPLRRDEMRNVFRAYVKAAKHRKGKSGHRVKSSREISQDLQGAASHKTVLEWMRQDFPSVHKLMILGDGDDMKGKRKRKNPGEAFAEAVQAAIAQVEASFKGVTDPQMRGELIARMRHTTTAMEVMGEWVEPPPEPSEEDQPF